jgi:ribosomal protein S18 acetylase RimI-like enzyme
MRRLTSVMGRIMARCARNRAVDRAGERDDERRALDRVAASATVAATEAWIAGWRCKADGSVPFRRCNVAMPPPGATRDPAGLAAALGDVGDWYHDRGRRLIVQVSSADPDAAALDRALADRGFALEAPVHLLVAPIAALTAPSDPPGSSARPMRSPPTVTVVRGVDEGWVGRHGRLGGASPRDRDRAAAYGRMLAALGDRALAAAADLDGVAVGVGFGVVDGTWLGIFGMATDPGARRRGVATAVVRALAGAGADSGATRAYLQVEVDNAPALGLYQGLGFLSSHRYHYRVDAPAPAGA